MPGRHQNHLSKDVPWREIQSIQGERIYRVNCLATVLILYYNPQKSGP